MALQKLFVCFGLILFAKKYYQSKTKKKQNSSKDKISKIKKKSQIKFLEPYSYPPEKTTKIDLSIN